MELIIGNKNYSSWSLRPWLLLSHFDIPFEETQILLNQENTHERLLEYSPSLKVPVLLDDDLIVWDSLSICEYVSEVYLKDAGWPEGTRDRAICRSYCAEMHSGFTALRGELPMNCRATRRVHPSAQALREIVRIVGMWEDALNRHDGDWLFGDFSIADCMFAPVVSRFATYRIDVSESSEQYMNRILTLPAMRRWYEAALQEQEIIEEDEIGRNVD